MDVLRVNPRAGATMGLLSWILAGLGAWLIARLIPVARGTAIAEIAITVVVSLTAGLVATLLDFGGWKVMDLRAAAFAALVSFAAIAVVRYRRLSASGRAL